MNIFKLSLYGLIFEFLGFVISFWGDFLWSVSFFILIVLHLIIMKLLWGMELKIGTMWYNGGGYTGDARFKCVFGFEQNTDWMFGEDITLWIGPLYIMVSTSHKMAQERKEKIINSVEEEKDDVISGSFTFELKDSETISNGSITLISGLQTFTGTLTNVKIDEKEIKKAFKIKKERPVLCNFCGTKIRGTTQDGKSKYVKHKWDCQLMRNQTTTSSG